MTLSDPSDLPFPQSDREESWIEQNEERKAEAEWGADSVGSSGLRANETCKAAKVFAS